MLRWRGAHHRFLPKRVTEKGKKSNLFTRNYTRNKRHQVELALCDIKKKFFTVRRIDQCIHLPRDMVESSSRKVFKT